MVNKLQTDITNEIGRNSQTVKSTFIMGGSSVVNIVLGIIRHKLIALIVNPSGFGLLGVYQSISNLATTVTGMGINESGARQVAIAFRSRNERLVARIAISLRRVAIITGCFGTLIFVLLSKRISILTFGNAEHAFEIALLSLTALFGVVSGGQLALIQGARKIRDLAKVNMLGPLLGTLLSLPTIYFLGARGIVSYLVAMSATNIITSWWYYRKVEISSVRINWNDSFSDSRQLLGLGAALMIGNILGVATSYLLRIILIRFLSLGEAGQFQAAFTISYVYVGILFKAMATDYYPRLSAASNNNSEVKSLVNEQIEAGLLLAVPGVLITLSIAPLIMTVFYSKKFLPGVEVLRWQALGILLQVVSWPLGYILRAKAKGILFVVTELLYNLCYIGLTLIAIRGFGLPGIGIAFFVVNIFYLILIYSLVRFKYEITFTPRNMQVITLAAITTLAAFSFGYILPKYYLPINMVLSVISGVYAYRKLALSEWIGRIFKAIKRKD